jgi:hypothetical protein
MTDTRDGPGALGPVGVPTYSATAIRSGEPASVPCTSKALPVRTSITEDEAPAYQTLIEAVFLDAFRNPLLEPLDDGAHLGVDGIPMVFTTDSYVVSPLFFPGGDIGDLAVNGTVNDLAVSGAEPLHLSAGFILEEGFPVESLRRVVASMKAAAEAAGVRIVTGDTKVVQRGKADGCYVNTAGVGVVRHRLGGEVRPGDVVLVSGSSSRRTRSRYAPTCGVPVNCWASTRCTSPARAAWSQSCRRRRPTPRSPRCAHTRCEPAPRPSKRSRTTRPGSSC